MSIQQNKITDPFSPYTELKFLILKEHEKRAAACFSEIKQLVQSSRSIPPGLFSEWVNYLYDPQDVKTNETTERFSKIARETVAYFAKDNQYRFTQENAHPEGLVFDFGELIYTVIQSYYNTIWMIANKKLKGKLEERKATFNFFYRAITDFSKPFDTAATPFISQYKKIVIASFITQLIGYTFVSGKNFTNKALYSAAKKYLQENGLDISPIHA